MPDGKTHFAVAIVALLPAAVAAAAVHFLGWWPVAVGVGAYLVGTVWLSPDLDLKSQPYMAWGPLSLIWWPYMKLVPHRSWWSHGPILGTLARVATLAAYTAIVVVILVSRGTTTLPGLQKVLRIDLWVIFAVLGGLEVSAWVHIALDKLLKN